MDENVKESTHLQRKRNELVRVWNKNDEREHFQVEENANLLSPREREVPKLEWQLRWPGGPTLCTRSGRNTTATSFSVGKLKVRRNSLTKDFEVAPTVSGSWVAEDLQLLQSSRDAHRVNVRHEMMCSATLRSLWGFRVGSSPANNCNKQKKI